MLDDTTAEWRREMGRVAQRTVIWQPAENSHSIGALILHIADVEAFWLHEIACGSPLPESEQQLLMSEETSQYSEVWPKPPNKPLAWYYDLHDRIRARTHELLADADDPLKACFRGTREFTLRWIIYHVAQHESYHGGQAVLLAALHKKMTRRRMTNAE